MIDFISSFCYDVIAKITKRCVKTLVLQVISFLKLLFTRGRCVHLPHQPRRGPLRSQRRDDRPAGSQWPDRHPVCRPQRRTHDGHPVQPERLRQRHRGHHLARRPRIRPHVAQRAYRRRTVQKCTAALGHRHVPRRCGLFQKVRKLASP